MTKSELAAKMQDAGAWLPGKTVKLDFGDDGTILLDGANNLVSETDGAGRHDDQGVVGRLAGDDQGRAGRNDRLHDRQIEGRRRHVQRDAIAGRAEQVAG